MNKVILFLLCLIAAVVIGEKTGYSCSDAIELELGYYNASIDQFPTSEVTCKRTTRVSHGIWYHYRGNGHTIILSTCDRRTDFDSAIYVFRGCGQECLDMDDDSCLKSQALLLLPTEQLHDYYVFVAGYGSEKGIVYFSATELEPAENFNCSGAYPVTQYPYAASGDTSTCLPVRNPCLGTEMDSGLWYRMENVVPDHHYIAHTCNGNTNFDTVIAVYNECTNDDADGCVTWNNDGCQQRYSLAFWKAEQTEYWVFVTGLHNVRGEFILAIEERPLNPYAHCSDPVQIASLPYYNFTDTSYLETTYSECRNLEQNAVFFRFMGSYGKKVIITTCQTYMRVNDTLIEVYEDCDIGGKGQPHKCVGYNDDFCGLGASLVVTTDEKPYYIAVSTPARTLGGITFTLSVLLYEETDNDECHFAKEIERIPASLEDNTEYKKDGSRRTPVEQSCDRSRIRRRGAWFSYTHNEPSKVVEVVSCTDELNTLQTQIEVYRKCNDFGTCVAKAVYNPETGCTNATFVVETGTTYSFFVTGADPSKQGGYFHADIFDAGTAPHTTCPEAENLKLGSFPYYVVGDNYYGKSSYSSCSNQTLIGYWVTFAGTGRKMVATTCDPEYKGFDGMLELYAGCPEDGVADKYCLVHNDDDPKCGRQASIEWESVSRMQYWLFVSGYNPSERGVFALRIYEKGPMVNQKCGSAIGIKSLPFTDFGYTTFSEPFPASCTTDVRKGVWYEIIGNGHWITVSTCNEQTDYATEIEVYMDCTESGATSCVAHNHDNGCSPHTVISFAAFRDQLFYIFITGMSNSGVMSEGFFGLTVTEGDLIPHLTSEDSEGSGLTSFQGFMVSVGVLMGVGLFSAVGAVAYGIYKKRHVSYEVISS